VRARTAGSAAKRSPVDYRRRKVQTEKKQTGNIRTRRQSLCSVCRKSGLTRADFSKRQWEKGESDRRCSKCVKEKRGDPHRLRKAAKEKERREKKAARWKDPPNPSARCMGCSKALKDDALEGLNPYNPYPKKPPPSVHYCPLCVTGEKGMRVKIRVCGEACFMKAFKVHWSSGACQRFLRVQEIKVEYGLRQPVSHYDDGGVDRLISEVRIPVENLNMTFDEVYAKFWKKRSLFRNEHPDYGYYPWRERDTVGSALWFLSYWSIGRNIEKIKARSVQFTFASRVFEEGMEISVLIIATTRASLFGK